MKLSSVVVGDSNDDNNFLCKLVLIDTYVSRLCKTFVHNSSTSIKLSKTQLHKIEKSGRSLSSILGPLLKTGLLLMKNVLKPIAKSVLIPLGLTEAISAIDAFFQKKMSGSSMTALIILNKEMNDIMKIVKSLEASGLLIKASAKQSKINQRNKNIAYFLNTTEKDTSQEFRINKINNYFIKEIDQNEPLSNRNK